jgi:hypothetical protein
MRRIIIILSVFTFTVLSFSELSCSSKYSKKNHVGTIKISEHLYYEIFQVYAGGTLANDSYSDYLTDSVNFRKYVGTVYYDDEKNYCKALDSNRVLVYRLNIRNKSDTLEQRVYIKSDLIMEGSFD